MSAPIKKFRCGLVHAAIFDNGGGYLTVQFSKSYKDAEGNWKYAHSFGAMEVAAVAQLAQMVTQWMIQHPKGQLEDTTKPKPRTALDAYEEAAEDIPF